MGRWKSWHVSGAGKPACAALRFSNTGGGDQERDQRARKRRLDRIERFTKAQRARREWINFSEIAEWCSLDGRSLAIDPEKKAAALRTLANDLQAGDFVEEGKHGLRSSVLYLHEATVMTRMTRERLEDALATTHRHPEMYVSEYLSHCWIPRRLFDAWLVKYGLPEDPPRFRPKLPPLQKAKRGRPVEYNWLGVGPKIKDYVSQNGPMKTFDELLQKCMDFARDLHPKGKTPDESTTKKAIEKYKLRVIARLGKMQRKSGER